MLTKKEKELVKKLKQKMPQFTGTKVEIEKKIAMFIYLELGKEKVFDERYFLANSKEKEKIHKKYNKLSSQKDKIVERRRVVCLTISTLYRDLLKSFGIEAFNEGKATLDGHIYNLIKFSDGTMITADLQRDLSNIQTRSKTKHFGDNIGYEVIIDHVLDDEELFELHKACGYVESKEDYMDEKIQKFKEQVGKMPPDELLQKIIKDEELNNFQKDIGYIELYNYYLSLFRTIDPESDEKGINHFNCYYVRTDEKGNDYKDYTMCIYSEYKNEVKVYLYSKVRNMFVPVDLDKLDYLERHGFFLGKNPNETGVKKLRRYMNNNLEKRIKEGKSPNASTSDIEIFE